MKKRAVDLFCGAGGTSIGAHLTGAVDVVCAVNHWDVAIQTHSANFPETQHINSRLEFVRPSESPRMDILFASPECTHHSRARGGRPTSDQQRSGAWEVLPWIEFHRPSFFVIENVTEFQHWGPVGRTGRPLKSHRGKFFDAWLQACRGAGYRVDFAELDAADHGACTSRRRLFVIGRKGNRAAPLPEPTHSGDLRPRLPTMERLPWRAAHEVIDWSIPCPSIFTRKRPLCDKTLLRIAAGLRKFVEPFVVQFRQNVGSRSLESPVSTITAGGNHHGIAIPFIKSTCGGGVPRGCEEPTPTFTTRGGVILTVPYIANVNHGVDGHTGGRNESLTDPLGTITSRNGRGIVIPFLSSYYGQDSGASVTDPVPTIVTKDRHALICAEVGLHDDSNAARTDADRVLRDTMRELGVCDIGFRMVTNIELALAQGFPAEYLFCGMKHEITRQIGNSVSPHVATAITASLLGA